LKFIEGGVCAAKGFTASGVHAGVKTKNADKKDVALIFADRECAAAAVYTRNAVKAAPVLLTRKHLEDGRARAVIVNSGNANVRARDADAAARRMCRAAAAALGIAEGDVAVASTGVIGQRLRVEVIEDAAPKLAALLSASGSGDAAEAIMTTDTVKKECAVECEIGGKTVRVGGIAKGSGMIRPNMGTMLAFITTDCAISPETLGPALRDATRVSFNRVSIDGDTSTNDMCVVLASGAAGNAEITGEGADCGAFLEALTAVCVDLARKMAADGEGAKHFITCAVSGAGTEEQAETLAKAVVSSTLFKAAIFGADANWGRALCAMGYSGADFDIDAADISFRSAAGTIAVCERGIGLDFDEALAKKILTERDIEVLIDIGEGGAECTCWGCDITYDYIRINGDYRT
jgi:glutamate N-acetyltransferase/amino-acid N-acetyltransferase